MKKLIFSVLLLGIFSSGFLSAQSSIYQDAKQMADLLRNTPVPVVDFKGIWSGSDCGIPDSYFYYFEKDGSVVKSFENVFSESPTYPIKTFGKYRLMLNAGDNSISKKIQFSTFKWDAVSISFLDSTIVISDSLLRSVDIIFSPDNLSIISNYENELEDFVDNLWPQPPYPAGNGNKRIVYETRLNFQKISNIMRAHSDFGNTEEKSSYSIYTEAKSKYKSNPFFSNLLQSNEMLFPKTNRYDAGFGRSEDSYSEFFQTNYEWHNLLYGDSTLQIQKQVSYQDVVSNYRTPIITSQKELVDANSVINEKNKNRNVLDAKTVAVGLSDFIAERSQEELNLTFFNRFKENLDKDSELTVLFPNTKKLLYQFEISNYKTLLANARESFTVDLDNLGLNFPKVLELDKYSALNNSPEVYNLALIYSITTLAYQEVPVESILISTYQKLQERERQLEKSINLDLAKAILNPLPDKGKLKKGEKVFQPKTKRGTELNLLETYIEEYLKEIESSKNTIIESTAILNTEFNKYNFESSSDKNLITNSKDRYHAHLKNIWRITQTTSKKETGLAKFFNDRYIPLKNKEYYESNYLDFYRKTIYSNLKGKEHYGYLLNDPNKSLSDYELNFKNELDDKSEIVASGLARSRHLLDENIEDVLFENLEELKMFSSEVREIKSDLLQFDPESRTWEKQIRAFGNLTLNLKNSIEEELIFWKQLSQQDETDHQIAGLLFLQALLDSDKDIKTFIGLHDVLFKEKDGNWEKVKTLPISLSSEFGMDIEFINYYVLLGLNKGQDPEFTQTMKKASETLAEIKINFEEKIAQLVNTYGNTPIDSTWYLQKLNLYSEILKNKRQYKIDQQNYEGKIEAIDDEYFKSMALYMEENKIQEENNPNFQRLKSKLQSIADSDEAYTSVQDSLDYLSNRYQEDLLQLTEPLNKKKEVDIAALEKPTLNQIPNASPMSTSNSTVKDIYQLSDNYYLKQYEEGKNWKRAIDSLDFASLDELDARLQTETDKWQGLFEKRQQIESHLNTLENDYCKNLLDAKVNARNFSKGIELATHLLYAFRHYDKNAEALSYSDTSRVVITTNQIDSITGYILSSSRLDTMQINKKLIDESTKEKQAARWITRKEFEELKADDLQWNLFLGLLYQRMRSIDDTPEFSTEGIALLATKFLNVTHEMDGYRTNLRMKKATQPESISFKDYYPFIRSTVDLFNIVITTQSFNQKAIKEGNDGTEKDIVISALLQRDSSLQLIPELSNHALSLYENLYVREYGNAVLNSIELLRTISSEKLDTRQRRKSERAINAVMTYGTFMANMINAESSDQIKTILKSVTLPPGSSRIKRETTSSFTLNSYLGAAVGRDVLVGAPAGVSRSSFGAAMSVPIGFTYSVSPNWIKNSSSLSLFVPLLDLGAITAYRQSPKNTNYSVDNLPEFNWENLFSPGLFAVYNFADSPFSLGVGGQYGPQLRKIEIANAEPVTVNSFRFPMVFFNIDVPFFNLHTGAKKIIVR